MRLALVWLLLLMVSTTNLAVAADGHLADPVSSSELAAPPGGDDPAGLACQICLHGPALTLWPQLPSLSLRRCRQPSPAHATRGHHSAALPDRIDEPPRPIAG